MARTNQSGRGCGGKGLGTGGGKKHRKVLRNNIQGLETRRLAELASEAEITRICSLIFLEALVSPPPKTFFFSLFFWSNLPSPQVTFVEDSVTAVVVLGTSFVRTPVSALDQLFQLSVEERAFEREQ
jgi:hypothetical protein